MEPHLSQMCFVVLYGEHLGKPHYFLVTNESVFALSINDAIRACNEGCDFLHSSMMTHEERNRVWDSWKSAEMVLGGDFEVENA